MRSTAFANPATGADLSRRGLLVAGMAALGAAYGGVAGAAEKPFFQRHGLPLGIQLYTLGPDLGRRSWTPSSPRWPRSASNRWSWPAIWAARRLNCGPRSTRRASFAPAPTSRPRGRRSQLQRRSRQAGRRAARHRREVGDHADPLHPRPPGRRRSALGRRADDGRRLEVERRLPEREGRRPQEGRHRGRLPQPQFRVRAARRYERHGHPAERHRSEPGHLRDGRRLGHRRRA
jgi:hypothetical protein